MKLLEIVNELKNTSKIKDPARLAAIQFLEENGYTTEEFFTLYNQDQQFFTYRDHHYQVLEVQSIKNQILNWLSSHDEFKGTVRFANELMAHIEAMTEERIEPNTWRTTKKRQTLIPFQNGLLDLKAYITKKKDYFQPHTPNYICHYCLNYDFDPKKSSTKWHDFLEGVLPDKDAQKLLKQWFGYHLMPEMTHQNFMIMLGEGANGKSVVCKVLTELLGPENVSHLGLEEIEPANFMFQMIVNRLANISDDMNEITKANEGHLKEYTGGSTMKANRKYLQPLNFIPTAKLTFATNHLPRIVDRSDGISRRILILPFDVQIPEERQNPQLSRMVYWRDELPAIFNWSVEGLRALLNQRGFTKTRRATQICEDHKRETAPEIEFLERFTIAEKEAVTRSTDLYQAYKRWCQAEGYRALSHNRFSRSVTKYHCVAKSVVHRPAMSKLQYRAWSGISFDEMSLDIP